MGAEKGLKGAEGIFIALLVIGLIGLLFLIIFGNLSTNLGFSSTSKNYVNESDNWLNYTPFTHVLLHGANTTGFISLAVTEVRNATENELIPAANYTVDATAGTIVNATTSNYPNMSIDVSYTVTHKGDSELDTEAVIANLSGGATQFFTFANVWFILTAITILIGIVIGVIALVRGMGGSGFGRGKKGRSEFTT